MDSDMTLAMEKTSKAGGKRLLGWILLITMGSIVAGSLLAPFLFNGLVKLGQTDPRFAGLRDLEFDSVTSRCVLVVLLIGVAAMLKISGMMSREELGFKKDPRALKRILWGFLIGCLTLVCVYAAGWMAGVYSGRIVWKFNAITRLFHYLVGALVVGLIEETVCRGVIFGLFKRSVGLWMGAVLSSLLFALVHFARPAVPVGTVYGHWNSGLGLMGHLFGGVGWTPHFFPMVLTLFVMGMILCVFYDRYGNLYFIIGLHAGWVWVMRSGVLFFDNRKGAALRYLFGSCEEVVKGYVVLSASLLLLAVALYSWSRAKRIGASA